MVYLYEDTLRKKAEEFIQVLAKWRIKSEIVMVRDYFIKISIEKEGKNYGNLIIDYKAKKNTFSIRVQELKDKSIEQDLVALWERGELLVTSEGNDIFEIYVDGSFINDNIGYGVVILKNGRLYKELSGQVTDPVFMGSRQVGGEITAVIEALKWCKDAGISEVTIYYDFANLEKWIAGEFSTKTLMSEVYKDYVQNCGIKINWRKVAGHTGVRWNEKADKLAGNAARTQASKVLIEDCKDISHESGSKNSSGNNYKENSKNLLDELEEIAEKFAFFLEDHGFMAEYLRIDNGMAAKICLEKDGETLGYINIYNTSKLHLQPRYHEIRNEELRNELDKLWNCFMDPIQE